MKVIEDTIFLGGGDASLVDIGHLYTLVARALNLLSAYQQPCHCSSEKEAARCEFERKLLPVEINRVAEEIFTALGKGEL